MLDYFAGVSTRGVRRPRAILGGALLVLATADPTALAAQDRVAFRHLTIADGLSQNAVSAILQDRRGFMWFGTKDGLNRYDGYQFNVYRHDPFDSTSISDSDILALHEDQAGALWVGTRVGGLNRFDRKGERFQRFSGGPRSGVTSIASDERGTWVGSAEEGLFLIPAGDTTGSRIQRYTHDPLVSTTLSSDRVNAILMDKRGDLWVANTAGLDHLARAQENRFRRYGSDPTGAQGFVSSDARSLYED